MKPYIINATAPTVYQLNSLIAFGMGWKKHLDGSFSASKEFQNENEAKNYLRNRADQYNGEDPNGNEIRLADMYYCIEKGHLTLDAVTAHIEDSLSV